MAYRILTRFDDNDIDAVQWGNYDIEKYIEPATLLTKTDFKSKINALNSDTNNFYENVTSISRSQTPPNSSVAVQNINKPDTVDILIWINPSSSTELLYYCQQDTIYLPENSSGLFYRFLKLVYLDITGWDTSKVTDMSELFKYARINYSNIIDQLSNWDVSNVTNMSGMFGSSYTDDHGSGYTLDLHNWDVSNVTNMSDMFSYLNVDSINISGWNTLNVTDMNSMFSGDIKSLSPSQTDDTKTNVIGIEDLNTSNVTNMSDMFNGNEYIESIDLSKWNTSKVTDMSAFFLSCKNLKSINVSNWDTSKVINMDGMLSGCDELSTIIGTGFNLDSIKSMNCMFELTPVSLNEIANIIDFTNGITIGSSNRMVSMYRIFARRFQNSRVSENYNFTVFANDVHGMFEYNQYRTLNFKNKIYSENINYSLFNNCDISTLIFYPFPTTSIGHNHSYDYELGYFCNGGYGLYYLFYNATIDTLRINGVSSTNINNSNYNFFSEYIEIDYFDYIFSNSSIGYIYCTNYDYNFIKDYVGSDTNFYYQ